METTTSKYKIVTIGNGVGVTVTRLSDGWDFFLQGDDATLFLGEIENAQRESEVGIEPCIHRVIEDYDTLFTNPAPISGKL